MAQNVEMTTAVQSSAAERPLNVQSDGEIENPTKVRRLEIRDDKDLSPGLASKEDDNNTVNGRRKRHRRKNKGGRHHRKWKPYTSLSWEEKMKMDERETRRATQKREKRFASGQAMAPYNTTQFLMEQHEPSDKVFNIEELEKAGSEARRCGSRRREYSGSQGDSSDDYYYDSSRDEEVFLEKEFTETYENFHAERLQTMTKDDLVREYIELESKVERLEKQASISSQRDDNSQLKPKSPETADGDEKSAEKLPDEAYVKQLEDQIRILKEENMRLREEMEKKTAPPTTLES